jgi:hypothetical protein
MIKSYFIFDLFSVVSFILPSPVFGMGGGGGGFDDTPAPAPPPPPEPPPPIPTKENEEVTEKVRDTKRAESRKKGRSKTILSGELQPANTQKKQLLGG